MSNNSNTVLTVLAYVISVIERTNDNLAEDATYADYISDIANDCRLEAEAMGKVE